MAKQPKWYPNLPRDRSRKPEPRVRAILIRTDVRVPRIIRADRTFKPTKAYTPAYLEETSSVSAGFNERSGTKNKDWRVTIAKGGDATSNYSREHYVIQPTTYSILTESPNWLSRGRGTLYGGMLRLENDQTALNNRAIGALKNKLQGKVGNAKLLAPLAESREIHRLVRQINGLGMNAFKALLAAKKTKGKSLAKQAGDIWLGLGFGVNPLLHDLKTAADSILKFTTRQDYRIVITGTATTEYLSGSVPTSSSEFIAQDAAIAWYRAAKHIQGIRYVAGVDLTVRSGSSYSVEDHLGLKLSELPSTLWELMAFSWAVDYFTTVGSWLDDMFYTVPGIVKYVSKNYKYQSDTACSPRTFLTAGTTAAFSGSVSRTRYTLFTRTQLAPVFPVRSLSIKSADEIASHGLTKLLNLASVLIGRNRGAHWNLR